MSTHNIDDVYMRLFDNIDYLEKLNVVILQRFIFCPTRLIWLDWHIIDDVAMMVLLVFNDLTLSENAFQYTYEQSPKVGKVRFSIC